jgi:hypothetical protein
MKRNMLRPQRIRVESIETNSWDIDIWDKTSLRRAHITRLNDFIRKTENRGYSIVSVSPTKESDQTWPCGSGSTSGYIFRTDLVCKLQSSLNAKKKG